MGQTSSTMGKSYAGRMVAAKKRKKAQKTHRKLRGFRFVFAAFFRGKMSFPGYSSQ
jgi:hypothetical protein